MLKFNPNDPAKQKDRPIWATYIPGRHPAFKQHQDRGMALNAMQFIVRPGILYHWIDGEWVEIYQLENVKPDKCARCSTPITWNSWDYHRGAWIGKPELEYVTLCKECFYQVVWKRNKDGSLRVGDVKKVDDRELTL